MGLQNYTQDVSKIPLKYHITVLFYNKYTHPTLICRGTHGRTNIYSVFRDKLLLRGEHVYVVDFVSWYLLLQKFFSKFDEDACAHHIDSDEFVSA